MGARLFCGERSPDFFKMFLSDLVTIPAVIRTFSACLAIQERRLARLGFMSEARTWLKGLFQCCGGCSRIVRQKSSVSVGSNAVPACCSIC